MSGGDDGPLSPAQALHVDDVPLVEDGDLRWRPVRRALGITAFGVNAWQADAGEELIEPHDELAESGAAVHEELYLVIAGQARFVVDGSEIDAPAGTFVFVPDPRSHRVAHAVADGTTAVSLGGATGTIEPSEWEERSWQEHLDHGSGAG